MNIGYKILIARIIFVLGIFFTVFILFDSVNKIIKQDEPMAVSMKYVN